MLPFILLLESSQSFILFIRIAFQNFVFVHSRD